MLASNQHGIKKTGYTYPLEAVVAKKKKKNTHTHTKIYGTMVVRTPYTDNEI